MWSVRENYIFATLLIYPLLAPSLLLEEAVIKTQTNTLNHYGTKIMYWPTHGSLSTFHTVSPQTQPVSISLSAVYCPPCSGLVKTLAYIFSVPKCFITASPPVTRSFIQKYLTSMCRVFSAADLPLFISARQDMLSWYTVSGPVVCPCAMRNRLMWMPWLHESDRATIVGWQSSQLKRKPIPRLLHLNYVN